MGHIAGGHVVKFVFAADSNLRTEALEHILEYAYNGLIDERAHNREHSEDALTVQIVQLLKALGIQATHDQQQGGHCDITVEADQHYFWIGEAKIHSSYNWLLDGFKQLSTRYGVARPARDHGEIIIYCRAKNARLVLSKWKSGLVKAYPDLDVYEEAIDTDLRFRTKHECLSSGLPFYTRHRILPLYFKPEK